MPDPSRVRPPALELDENEYGRPPLPLEPLEPEPLERPPPLLPPLPPPFPPPPPLRLANVLYCSSGDESRTEISPGEGKVEAGGADAASDVR